MLRLGLPRHRELKLPTLGDRILAGSVFKDDPANQHRHVSHLWGVHPGSDITWKDKKFFDAAQQSLVYRGDAATGFGSSCATQRNSMPVPLS